MNTLLSKSIKAGILAGSLASLAAVSNVHAASGTTQVDITFPPLVILYYYDNIDITVDAADLTSLLSSGVGGCTNSGSEYVCGATTNPLALSSATVSGSQASYDANIEGDAGVPTNATTSNITFIIENSWAVRALGGTLAASIALNGGDFSAGSAVITPAAPTTSILLTDGANVGDIQFDVDVSAITGTTASDQVTITVTSS